MTNEGYDEPALSTLLDFGGNAAAEPPRKNGDLEFAAPWETRALGMALALSRSGVIDWPEFARRLQDRLAMGEAKPDAIDTHGSHEPESAYYVAWEAALEEALEAAGVINGSELRRYAQSLDDGH
jgi:nitrile hydratase accessory protein